MGNIQTRKLKREKQKQPYISPQNRMAPEDMPNEKINPIIEMKPKEIMPLSMFISDLIMTIPLRGSTGINYMVTISHNKKTNTLTTKGRARFEDTGRKITFGTKSNKIFKLKDLKEVKTQRNELYKELVKSLNLKELHTPTELNFKVDEDIDSIISKLNKSNLFNIGIMQNKKQK